MINVISYLRYSTDDQQHGDSERRQNEAFERYLHQHRDTHILVKSYADRGVSGFSGQHVATGELAALLSDITSGVYARGTVLIVENLDRLSRQDLDAAQELFKNILRAGLDIITLQDGSRYTPDTLNSLTGLVQQLVHSQRAHEESRAKSERMRSVWAAKRASGKIMTRAAPAWLVVNSDRTAFEPVPEKVAVIQRIFELKVQGESLAAIAKILNSEAVPPMTSKATAWNQSSIQQLLVNKALIGFKVPSRNTVVKGVEPIPDYYPMVISAQLFYAAEELKNPRFGGRYTGETAHLANILKGVAKCGMCGSTMIINGSSKRHGYYVCSFSRNGRCDNKTYINRQVADTSIVMGLLQDIDRLPPKSDRVDSSDIESQLLKKQTLIAYLNSQTEELILQGLKPPADTTKRIVDHQRDIEALQRDLQHRHQLTLAAPDISRVFQLDLNTKADRLECNLIVRRVISLIAMLPDRTANITLQDGTQLLHYPLTHTVGADRWLEIVKLVEPDATVVDLSGVSIPPVSHE